MDPLTLYTIGSGIYNVADGLNQKSRLLGEAATADQEAAAAKLAGEQAYAEQLDSTKFRTKQAPTRAADLTLSLAEQGLDFTRDQGQAAQAQLLAGLRDDPRNVGGLLRGLNQIGQNVQGAEQNAGRQAIAAQKIIDDSIFNQQEAERQRLSNLQKTYELDPAMAAYTQATGAADAYRTAAEDASRAAIADTLAAGAQVAGQMRNQTDTDDKSDELRTQQRDAAEQSLQAQLAQPILIDDADYDPRAGIASLYSDDDVFTPTPVEPEPEQELLEAPISDNSVPLPGGPLAGAGPERGIVDISTAVPSPINPDIPDPDFEPFNLDLRNQRGNPYLEGINAATRATGGGGLTREDMPNVYPPSSIQPVTPLQTRGAMQIPNLTSPNVIMINGVAIPTTAEQELTDEELFDYAKGGTYIGERGGMTEGDFDHSTNKKAIIDEESGKKEGELTGGEGVLNEDHLADIVKLIKEGDEDGLLAFLKSLLEEPQFGYDFA